MTLAAGSPWENRTAERSYVIRAAAPVEWRNRCASNSGGRVGSRVFLVGMLRPEGPHHRMAGGRGPTRIGQVQDPNLVRTVFRSTIAISRQPSAMTGNAEC